VTIWLSAAIAGALFLGWYGSAQEPAAESPRFSVQVTLELHRNGTWLVIDPRSVLKTGDEIRFRFRTSAAGFLRVLNVSSDGRVAWLFPLGEEGSARVLPESNYEVPAHEASFIVAGIPGFDTTYWFVSSTGRDIPANRAVDAPHANTLAPRCHEGLLKSRGVCLDERAGPRPIPKEEPLPRAVSGSGRLYSRGIEMQNAGDAVNIWTERPHPGVLAYEFRIAHR